MTDNIRRYAIEVKGFDFGLLNARNQLISKLINPALGPHEIRTAAFAAWLATGWALVRR